MFDIFGFSVLLLVTLQAGPLIFSAAEECKKSPCPLFSIAADPAGKIAMTVWYDNDEGGTADNRNTDMVLKACQAMDTFKDMFSVDFRIGAGTSVGADKELVCLHDCWEDQLEGCVAMNLDAAKFSAFVCANNRGTPTYEAAEQQGITKEVLDDCHNNERSNQYLLNNGDARRKAGITDCHLPEFALNNVINNCIIINTFDDLKKALCEIYNRAEAKVPAC